MYALLTLLHGFTSVVEWAHCRRYINARNWPRVLFTGVAAIMAGYIASECLQGEWPRW